MLKHFLLTLVLLVPTLVLGQETTKFVPLVGVPNVDTGGSFESFINTLYYLSIGIAALLAVIKIIIAGVKYMLSDIVTDKGDAKKDIKGALFGLLIVLGAVLILEFINPQLTNINAEIETIESPEYIATAPRNEVELPGQSDLVLNNISEEECPGDWTGSVCIIRGGRSTGDRNTGGSGGGVDINMWTERVPGVTSVSGSYGYGYITPELIREIPPGAFLGVGDDWQYYDETGALDMCRMTSPNARFTLNDLSVTKVKTCPGHRAGSIGVTSLTGNRTGVDIWISTEPGSKASVLENCGPREVLAISGDVRFLQPSGVELYNELDRRTEYSCILEDDTYYYLNFEKTSNCNENCSISANFSAT